MLRNIHYLYIGKNLKKKIRFISYCCRYISDFQSLNIYDGKFSFYSTTSSGEINVKSPILSEIKALISNSTILYVSVGE